MEDMKAVILTADNFEDLEVFYPYYRLKEEGIAVDLAGPKSGHLHGEKGYSIRVDKTFDKVDPDEYDILVLPGGGAKGAPATVRKNVRAQRIAQAFMKKDKPIAAICHGSYTLISADVVKGRHMTSFWGDGVPEELKKAGALYEDSEVVVDGNLVSSRSPLDLPAFMREVMKMIKKFARGR